jgi:hypothetical protein
LFSFHAPFRLTNHGFNLAVAFELPPPFLSQALAGKGAPFNARGHPFPANRLPALMALHPEFIREDFNLSTTVWALI